VMASRLLCSFAGPWADLSTQIEDTAQRESANVF
jgi:hypothetical protein